MTGQTIGLLLVMIIYLILMVGIGVLAFDGTARCCVSFRLC